MSRDHVIETHGLSKSYGHATVVQNLDLRVASGTITAFLGRNGAGKSTTIRMLLGMVRPTSGTGNILGRRIDIPECNCQARRTIAYVSEDKPLFRHMTVEQLIYFTRSFYSDWRSDVEKRLVSEFGLPLQGKTKQLSRGMRTKLALLLALARRPELLILDEPSEGLDPVSVEQLLQELVRVASEGTTIFFSSHQIAEVERIADELRIIDRGKLLVDLSMDELRGEFMRITCGFASLPPQLDNCAPGVFAVKRSGRQVSVLVRHDVDSFIEYAQSLGAVSVDVSPVSLRELFLESVNEAGGEE